MGRSFVKIFALCLFVFFVAACEKDDPPIEEDGCKNIEETKNEKWAITGEEPINLADKLSSFEGNDGSDYVRCRFILECDDVCPDESVNVEIKYEYNNDFPPDSDYAITDLKLEALFLEYHWNEANNEKVFDKNTIPMSFLGSGQGSATGDFQLTAPFKPDEVYGQIGALIDFTFRIKNPEKPSEPKEVLERIIAHVEITISYKR